MKKFLIPDVSPYNPLVCLPASQVRLILNLLADRERQDKITDLAIILTGLLVSAQKGGDHPDILDDTAAAVKISVDHARAARANTPSAATRAARSSTRLNPPLIIRDPPITHARKRQQLWKGRENANWRTLNQMTLRR